MFVPIGASLTTVVNATVVISCPYQGTPRPDIMWRHNQRAIVPGLKYNMSRSSLIISTVQLEDGGSYACIASSKFGRDSKTLNLTVTGDFDSYANNTVTLVILLLREYNNCKDT